MSKYQLGLYEKALPSELSWGERFKVAKASGFDYLEISVDESDARLARLNWTAAERYQLLREIEAADCRINSMCLSGHRKYPLGDPDPAKRERGLEIMEQAIQLSVDLGVRIIQLAGYDTYYAEGTAETERFFRENLARAAEMAAKKGVILGFETMETPFMDTVEKAMHYVNLIQSPYLGVYPDIGNLKNASLLYGKSVPADLATGRGHIFASHLKETIPGHYREIPFGTGHTDYVPCIEELAAQGVRLFVGEFWYKGSPNWQEDTAFAAAFLRGHLDQVLKD